ncbi:methionine aminopeptidase 1 [Tieghemostelium lacteum]|uniref:Methionine aminopeptidase n=1 Tax=Tieghemostelium lacteum TaxID=361077 RepID=A0A151Z9B1_TIELA|nr:methionine aminopeptidase 1 [Tieghemostelium lacteum]|eukprot:KYQ90527.1 methionine aminopeptidase 1 [Tieghemostelium lacteum]
MSVAVTIPVKKCSYPACEKEAKLQCPTCLKLKIDNNSHFCSQECFKTFWPIHKLLHEPKATVSADGGTINTPATTNNLARFKGYKFTGPLRPEKVFPQRTVPSHIQKPDYADDSIPHSERASDRRNASIVEHTAEEIECIRECAKLAREVLDIAGDAAKVGMTTEELDTIVHNAAIERNAYPSTLNYYKYPKSCCTSVNEVICHGIPDARKLRDGDILNVDITLYYKGFHIDHNEMYLIGNVDEAGKKLVRYAYECLDKAIAMCKPGVLYRELGNVISKHANEGGFSVVKNFCGHGIGRLFHCNPSVPHYARNKAQGVMKPGHVFTIEPMINEGTWKEDMWPDDWTAVTLDGKRSAQFEHTLLITETGVEVLTARTKGSYLDRHNI